MGVSQLVKTTSYSIGFAEFGTAKRIGGINVGAIKNRQNFYVLPSDASIVEAASTAFTSSSYSSGNTSGSLPDPDGSWANWDFVELLLGSYLVLEFELILQQDLNHTRFQLWCTLCLIPSQIPVIQRTERHFMPF